MTDVKERKKILTIKYVSKIIAADHGVSAIRAEGIINKYFTYIGEKIKEGGEARINGFGTFKLKERTARRGRNPQTGEEIDVPASSSISFKPTRKKK